MGRGRRRRTMRRVKKLRERQEFDRRKFTKFLGQWILSLFIVIVVGYSLVTFGGQSVKVIGQSMAPVLQYGDTVIINKFIYTVGDVNRYDIVAFKLRDEEDSYYNIKRVIGLPGETVKIEGGHVFIDGKSLDDMPFDELIMTAGIAADGVTLGNNEYFVIGDNVNNSDDSRFVNIGSLEESEVAGKVIYTLFPRKNRGKIEYK